MKNTLFIKILFAAFFLIFETGIAQAQTISLTPSSLSKAQNSNFSLVLNIDSADNLFSVYFDLDYNPSLISFVSATEGTFMSQGCETSLMSAENPAGKLIVGLTRLGEPCGGISGSGGLMTLNFKTLSQDGISGMGFSNNGLAVYNSGAFSDIVGNWNGASVTVGQISGDTIPPAAPTGVTVL